ncbi:MAG TPA: class I SAM-dependent methyltransferase family protein [Candidatus Thermoplasmatota archaeon]|nr:class I SAM-dependent methyltransferase family protein [Candidatus Thermoplasmatota archaeon]
MTPFTHIKTTLSAFIPSEMIHRLPDKWEKIGTVVTIKLPEEVGQYKQIIGKAYAEVLGCKTTLNDTGGVSGVFRNPVVEVIFGSSETETIHSENGIRFRLDPQTIMFSSGNMTERRRMATIAAKNETVVDLFAGIGYFTLPMAVYSKPKKIFACEINPIAYSYLCANVVLNHVSSIVEPLLGDNRRIAPKDCADRVILGYLKDPQGFLRVALECLRNHTGVLHYHELVPVELIPDQPLSHIETVANMYHRSLEVLTVNEIKSYAPRVNHMVLDVRIFE